LAKTINSFETGTTYKIVFFGRGNAGGALRLTVGPNCGSRKRSRTAAKCIKNDMETDLPKGSTRNRGKN
jgi:hypothetical protein